MSLNLSDLKSELDSAVNEATSVVDLADKYADALGKYAAELPVVGPEAATVVKVLDALDKALHEAQSVLGAV